MKPAILDEEVLSLQARLLVGMQVGHISWINKKHILDAALWLTYDGMKAKYGGLKSFENSKKLTEWERN